IGNGLLNILRVAWFGGTFERKGPWSRNSNFMKWKTALGISLLAIASLVWPYYGNAAEVHGWLSWRGPQQNGASLEKNLPDRVMVKEALWVADFPGQSTPVIANGKVYI